MDELNQKDIFDMDAKLNSPLIWPRLQAPAVQQALDQDLYFSYPADPNEHPGTFIHEYKNGKKVLIKIDSQTGKEHFIKNL